MVNKHFSRGCHFCRSQHTRCDETKPSCRRCIARGIECPGYRDVNGFLFVDQNKKTAVRARKGKAKKTPSAVTTPSPSEGDASCTSAASSPPIMDVLAPDAGTTSVTFFVNTYLHSGRNAMTSRGHFDHLRTLYADAAPNSPLALATEAMAVRSFAGYCRQPFTAWQAKSLLSATQAMRAAIADPHQALQDSTLLAVVLLDFGDFVASSRAGEPLCPLHHRASLRLLKLRGAKRNEETEVGRSAMAAIGSNAVRQAIVEGDDSDLDDLDLLSTMDSGLWNPATRLNTLILSALKLRRQKATEVEAFEFSAKQLYGRVIAWVESIPEDWHPQQQQISGDLHKGNPGSVSTCELYTAIDVAYIYNQWRCTLLLVMLTMSHHQLECNTSPDSQRTEAQTPGSIVEAIRSSFPYFTYDTSAFATNRCAWQISTLGVWYLNRLTEWLLRILDQHPVNDVDEEDTAAIRDMRRALEDRYRSPGRNTMRH